MDEKEPTQQPAKLTVRYNTVMAVAKTASDLDKSYRRRERQRLHQEVALIASQMAPRNEK